MNELVTYLCDVCINIMEAMSDFMGISYGLLNILLFVILQPLAILSFMLSTFFCIIYHKTDKSLWKVLSIIFVISGFICVLAVVLPVLYTYLFLPW